MYTESSIVQLLEKGDNRPSNTARPHEILRYARRRGCVECEIASTKAGSGDKGFEAMRRSRERGQRKRRERRLARGECVAVAIGGGTSMLCGARDVDG